MQTKGISIRITEDLYNKLEDQDKPRNDVVTNALVKYFEPNQNFESDIQEIPNELYEEIYSNIYNMEIPPLKAKIDHQIEIISILKSQIDNLERDKQFLQNQCNGLIETCSNLKKESFWKKRKRKNKDKFND